MAKKVEQGENPMKSLAAIVGTERIRLVKEAVSLFDQLDLAGQKNMAVKYLRNRARGNST